MFLYLLKVSLILLLVSLGVAKYLHAHPFLPAILVGATVMVLYVYIIIAMIVRGKTKAPGAKDRRKRWLSWVPFMNA